MYPVWCHNDFGEFARWRQEGTGLSKGAADALADRLRRKNCDCSVEVLPDGRFPSGYEAEQRILNRGY